MKGITSLVAFVPEGNLIHAINTVISHFVEYSKYNVYEITVNSIYQEILDRQADDLALSHFSALLRDGQITEQDLRFTLLNSGERVFKQKTIDELNEETINVINDLYEKILLREVDPEGLVYFGNLFESGMTSDKIRAILLESDEGKNISSIHPVRSKILTIYDYIFDDNPDNSFVDHYHKMVDDGFVPLPDWIDNVIHWHQNGMISPDEASNSIRFLYNEGIIFPDERPSNEESVE